MKPTLSSGDSINPDLDTSPSQKKKARNQTHMKFHDPYEILNYYKMNKDKGMSEKLE